MKLEPAKSRTAKLIYLTFGILFLIVGLIGLILPVLPGWLFLIPSVFCFAKASPVFNKWLKKRKSFQKHFPEKP